MRAKEFILETTGDKKFDNMLRKIVDPTPSTAGNVWHKDLVYQLSRALPQNLFSDQILDPEDIRYYLGDNPLVDKFESLPIEEQDIVITAISNYFFEKNGSATGSKSNISSIHPSTNRVIGNISQKSSLLMVTDYNIKEKTFDLQINNKPYRIRVDDLVSYGDTAPYPDDWFIISGPTDNEAELDNYITSINNGQGLSEFLFAWDEKHNILSKMFPDIN